MDSITQKWIQSPADEYAVSQGCWFDERAADKVVEFFRRFLRHSKGSQWAGKPFELLDWQRDELIKPIYGWKLPNGLRRIRKVYCEIPKKNGKSTLGAGVGLIGLVCDGEPGAEVYSAATDQQQAGITHGEAINMVDASPELTSILDVNRSNKTISFSATKSVYKALSSEANSKEGLNASTIIVDELHVWYGRTLWDALKYASRARQQPLLFVITTAGDDLQSVCYEQRVYTQQVLSGAVQDVRFFGYIRAAEQEDDWTQESTWIKANPSLGHTFALEDFRADFQEAFKTPTTQSTFKRYSLNIWATGTNPWLRREDWQACKRDYTEADLEGKQCYAGLDLARTRDMSALVLVFPGDDGYRVLPYFWMPENSIQDRDREEYLRVWHNSDKLFSTPGDVCDYRFIREHIGRLSERFDIRGLYYDRYYAEQLTQEIEENYSIPRYDFAQHPKEFAGPTNEFERLLISQKLLHNDHPILTWQAGHVEVKEDAQANKRPVKPTRNDVRKVDGIVAAIMGLAGCIEHGFETSSVYETRGVVVL